MENVLTSSDPFKNHKEFDRYSDSKVSDAVPHIELDTDMGNIGLVNYTYDVSESRS